MSLISQIKEIEKKISGQILFDESLSKYSWFNLGGAAKVIFKPKNLNELSIFLKNCNALNSIKVLGAGSNTLIRDSGVKGVVIKLGSKFSNIELLEEDTVEVGASTLDRKVSDFAKNNAISGMEFLSCIPGSIGGAIIMNSGCYGSDISKILSSIKIIDEKGKEKEIKNNEIKFFYRGTNIPKNYIILSAVLKGIISSKQLIEQKQEELIERKKKSQPSQIKTGGSTFKNPIEQTKIKVWELIKKSVPLESKFGDAKISNKHCNFFVNSGKATFNDMKKLIEFVRKNVRLKTGIKLETEIEIIE